MSRNEIQQNGESPAITDSEQPTNHLGGDLLSTREARVHGHGHNQDHSKGHGKHQSEPVTYEGKINSYWSRVQSAKSKNELVTQFPPVRAGADNPRPLNPPEVYSVRQGKNPSLNEIVAASKGLLRQAYHDKKQPDFNLSRIDENEFKFRYAREAVRVGADFGLSKSNVQNIVQRIYAFEDGGWGTHETLSSMPQYMLKPENEQQRKNYHPLSSAIGYNQLLMDNSVTDVRKHGTEIATRLDQLASAEPERAKELTAKAELVRALQNSRGNDVAIKRGMHALNLDGDIGPIIQSIELQNLLKFAKENDFETQLGSKAARIMANAAKYDSLPDATKQSAVGEVISRLRPPPDVASTPETLKQWESDREELRTRVATIPAGDSEVLARKNLSDSQYALLNTQLLQLRKFGGDAGPLSANAQLLVDKINTVYFRGFTADTLTPAALELANLAGTGRGLSMLQDKYDSLPTTNFFSRPGYDGNPTVARRSAGELLSQIHRVMHGPNASHKRDGIAGFTEAFSRLEDPVVIRKIP